MCLWKRERTYLFLPFGTTLVRLPHYAGGRCADKLEEYTAVLGNRASLDSIAGTYNGVLPPNVETTLTLNADGTYLLIQAYKEKQNEREKLRGTFQVLDNNVLMLVRPSSGDNIFYKVRDGNCIILIDSVGNEPEGETARFYVLKKRK
ncbi:copper resistance protein NlpE [Prevotella copri]|nr:copper resistance protein NlpE [Segatella copri]MBV3442236.1 copper resistance protein NlpE [Segatella copri]MBV3460614.1 copper resistance protein NlpE [Segatella copri]MBW0023110.1 copper resistance protein NlpE [Segatella copri]MBW0038405.1 copper resistance protein NlpE [Segatella copri]